MIYEQSINFYLLIFILSWKTGYSSSKLLVDSHYDC